ncbi:PLP-dependent aminotransferase family protein [Fulvivirgaceae bacterium BMA12]|uniref:PLP-dependent aminotransferase family protein n=1 Tax=Agaribacillus aureus TaxID=3051825 RepID=A0ABT8KZK7_9BACT|nr:PLP-dependent aminotransferase family protein [Fulvivirgaceae bacterium BMA12]
MLRPWDLQININLLDSKAVYLQIADAIIEAVKNRKLQPGDALPGSRKLAGQLKVNRNTVVKALDILLAEGWLEAQERKGIFVAALKAHDPYQKRQIVLASRSNKDQALTAKPDIVFDDGLPDSRLAPIKALAMAYRQIFNRKARWQMMGYSHALGDLGFRNAVVKMLNHKRGMGIAAENLCLTRGSQMALYLAVQCLLEKGDAIIIENPGYMPAWRAFENAGAELLPVSVEADGINLHEIQAYLKSGKKIKALYTTPHHHFPTTVSLSLQKRLELIQLSNTYGFTIIEDDYDHEFHFGARPLLPIGSLAPVENYIYVGTFSKIVSPALRIGYLASGEHFIDKVAELRQIIDVQGDNIMEQAVLELINDGSIRKHLNKATQTYHKKRDFFDQVIRQNLGDKVSYKRPEGGLAFWLMPRKKIDTYQLAEDLKKKNVQILTPDKFSFSDPIMGLRLGYASLSEEKLEEGIGAIARLL